MAAAELQVVDLRDDFYRDSFGKIVFVIISIVVAISLLIAVSLYLHLEKPKPITFAVDPEWRVQPVIPLEKPYLSSPDMLQWVNDALQRSFVFDFYHYNDQLKNAAHFFTPNGWKVFLDQLNNYVNYNNVQTNKMFVNAVPSGAPSIITEGLLSGRYAWWVEMPITISYFGIHRFSSRALTLQILVVRVSTLNNLAGVGIDNVIVANNTSNQQTQTGNG